MAEITLKGVEKVYPTGFHAVKSLNLEVREGELLVLLGPSGCGKSTTLRMIAGLEEVSGGTISIGGRTVNDVHPKDRDIAMVFQNYALYPHMTVRQNMGFALKMRRVARDQIARRVEAAAEMLHISQLLDRRPGVLSGGQRQRVAVGRAIVREPKAFLFDEPLSNLDAKLRTSTRGEIKALQMRLRTTTVYVTHDQEEAMTLGDRIAIMAGGQLQQIGTPMDLYRAPVNRFVADFLGTPPMNFLAGTLAVDSGGPVFTERGGSTDGVPLRVSLPRSWGDRLRPLGGKDAVLGVRPHAFSLVGDADSSSSDGPVIGARASLVEPLGDQMDITCATAGHTIVARVPCQSVKAGERVNLRLEVARAHVFEPGEMGRNLTA
ncbi:MAG TPA: sn-glycerol-3-phosphate ABC transporter ATP-binding protein UgpC [Phycisphaerales bacterium]|nr:sn-glycerol-3-phosphate ABC transporter ATP-binding protein UgpC [Phycisphaerales bacterium]